MIIDVNLSFGGREGIQEFPLETMLAEMRRIPGSVGFVHCREGLTDQAAGNGRTLALCREHPELRPVAVIEPRDVYVWQGEVARCLAAGCRMFRVSPEHGAWPADSVFAHELVARLAGTGAVLTVDATTPGLPSRLAGIAAPAGVPLLFTEARYYPLSELIPLMERYPNVYVETSRLTSPESVELCVSRVGAGRLLFGSGAARYPAWVAWQVIERAALRPEQREQIYARNAEALLGVRADTAWAASVPPPAGWAASNVPIIDAHMHDKFPGAVVKPYGPAEYEAAMAEVGIRQGVCSSVTAIFYDIRQGNDEVAALLASVPRLFGYVVVDPRHYRASVAELSRLETNPRFRGVKIHAAHAHTLTSSREMRRLFEAIAPYKKPVLIHNLGPDWPEALVEIATAHSDLPIIAAHSGYGDGPQPTHDAALRVAPAPNIFIEFCSTYLAIGAIRRGITAVGADRVLYGSDFPLIAEPYMLAAYEDADLTPEEVGRVLSANAARLFGI